jgi:tRNA1Val (adenine37-N6)-methyltransferase
MMKSGTHFRFKQFSVHHDRSSMKVGTDGVLLGAWTDLRNAKSILDIGTGSGLIALMLAQRSGDDVMIDAVEIHRSDAQQARDNFSTSPWSHKLNIHHGAIQNFLPEKKYDLIVSNPPYFINSQEPPDQRRRSARHTSSLTFEDLITVVKRMLHHEGTFNVILPYEEGRMFIAMAYFQQLYCIRQWTFRGRKEKAAERLLLEFSNTSLPLQTGELVLYNEENEWSDAYRQLTKDFYLKL